MKTKKSGTVKKDLDPDEKYKTQVFEDEMPLDEETRWRWIKRWIVSDPHLSVLNPDKHLGAVSEAFMGQVKKFMMDQGDHDLPVEEMLYSKYQQSLMPPGDQIGLVIAQSIGEPSTQMTLNTFHMAGKADVNITLGIPRLRELIMTAPTEVKTPSMTIPFHKHVTEDEADEFCKKLKTVRLSDLVTTISGENKLVANGPNFMLQTVIDISLGKALCKNFGLKPKHVLLNVLRKKLFQVIKKKHEKFTKDKSKSTLTVLHQKADELNRKSRLRKNPEKENEAEEDQEAEMFEDGMPEIYYEVK